MKKYILTMITMIGILYLLLMPTSDMPDSDIVIPYADKIIHFCLFGFLAFVFVLEQFLHKSQIKSMVKVITIFIIYALATETLQKLTGYRNFDLFDLLADSLGIIVGIIVSMKIFNIIESRGRDK